jgi:hypothetical protein
MRSFFLSQPGADGRPNGFHIVAFVPGVSPQPAEPSGRILFPGAKDPKHIAFNFQLFQNNIIARLDAEFLAYANWQRSLPFAGQFHFMGHIRISLLDKLS